MPSSVARDATGDRATLAGVRDRLLARLTVDRVFLAALAGVWAWLYLRGLGDPPVRTWDESRYVVPARNMVEGGSWLDPRLQVNSHSTDLGPGIRLRKPPLLYWLQAVSMTAVGVTEFAARLPTALATLGCAALVFHLGRRTADRRAALAGALAFLAFPGMLAGTHGGTAAVPDTALALFGSLFVWLTWRGRDEPRLLVPAGICAGLAVMTKGVAAGVFVVVVAPVVLASARSYSHRWTAAAVASTVLVALPWHCYAYLTYGREFVRQYFLVSLGARMSGELTDPPAEPVFGFMNYPYFRSVIDVLAPPYPYALPVFAVGLVCGLALVARRVSRDGSRAHRAELFLCWWVAAVPLTFAVAGGNQPWYLLPMYLPGAVLLGLVPPAAADALAGRARRGRGPTGWAGGASSGRPDGGPNDRIDGEPHRSAWRPRARTAAYPLACLALVALLVTAAGPPIVEPYDHEQRALGTEIRDEVPADATVAVWIDDPDDTRALMALSFYADRRLVRASPTTVASDRSIRYAIVPLGRQERLDRDHRVLAVGPKNDVTVLAFGE